MRVQQRIAVVRRVGLVVIVVVADVVVVVVQRRRQHRLCETHCFGLCTDRETRMEMHMDYYSTLELFRSLQNRTQTEHSVRPSLVVCYARVRILA